MADEYSQIGSVKEALSDIRADLRIMRTEQATYARLSDVAVISSKIADLVPRGEHRIEMDSTKAALDGLLKKLTHIESHMATKEDLDRVEGKVDGGPVQKWIWSLLAALIATASLIFSIRH